VFALTGRGIDKHLVVNAESGRLGDTDFSKDDLAARICPVGVILHKGPGFAVPIGKRTYDTASIRSLKLKEEES
jgi:[NiFe] hydrogenase diaphorase moiety small subunit